MQLPIGFVPITGLGHHGGGGTLDWLSYYSSEKVLFYSSEKVLFRFACRRDSISDESR